MNEHLIINSNEIFTFLFFHTAVAWDRFHKLSHTQSNRLQPFPSLRQGRFHQYKLVFFMHYAVITICIVAQY